MLFKLRAVSGVQVWIVGEAISDTRWEFRGDVVDIEEAHESDPGHVFCYDANDTILGVLSDKESLKCLVGQDIVFPQKVEIRLNELDDNTISTQVSLWLKTEGSWSKVSELTSTRKTLEENLNRGDGSHIFQRYLKLLSNAGTYGLTKQLKRRLFVDTIFSKLGIYSLLRFWEQNIAAAVFILIAILFLFSLATYS